MEGLKKPIYVTKAFLPPMDEYNNKIQSIWENNWLTNNGKLHREFEERVTKYLNVKNTSLFVNGHLALDIAIKTLGLKGEVITTPFTFASTTHAITMNNLTPIFCDINIDDFTIDVSKIEELITTETSAIIPVHVFGYPCDIKNIERIAQKHDLKVIYDAAHAFGVEVDGMPIGNFGDISMFSMHATKVFNSIEGGLLTFKEQKYEKKMDMYKNFGITGVESVEEIGLNAKMNEFQAAMGLINLKYIDNEIKKRQIIFQEYRKGLKGLNGIYYLKDRKNITHNYSYFPIVIDENILGINRNLLYEELKKYNIYTRKYFHPLVTEYECYKNKFDDSNIPNAKNVAENILVLPIYGDLSLDIVVRIVEIIKFIVYTNTTSVGGK